MVVFATPDRLDTSSMVSSPRPDSVSRSRAAASTRSRERTTRGSAAALTPGTGATSSPPPLPSVSSATCAPPAVLTSSLRYRSGAQSRETKEAANGPRLSPHHHRRPRRHGGVLREGNRNLGGLARARFRRAPVPVVHPRPRPHEDGGTVQ